MPSNSTGEGHDTVTTRIDRTCEVWHIGSICCPSHTRLRCRSRHGLFRVEMRIRVFFQPLHIHSHNGTGHTRCPFRPSVPSNHCFACSAWKPWEQIVQKMVNLCMASHHCLSRSCLARSSSTTSMTSGGKSAVESFLESCAPVIATDGAFELGPIAVHSRHPSL